MDWGSRISLILNKIWFVPIEDQSRNQFNDLLITSTCKISTENALPSHLKKHLLKYMLLAKTKILDSYFGRGIGVALLTVYYSCITNKVQTWHDVDFLIQFTIYFYNTNYLLKSVSLDLWASLILITQCCVFNIHKPGWYVLQSSFHTSDLSYPYFICFIFKCVKKLKTQTMYILLRWLILKAGEWGRLYLQHCPFLFYTTKHSVPLKMSQVTEVHDKL